MITWGWNTLLFSNLRIPTNGACCNPGAEPFGEECVIPRYTCGAPADAGNETCLACNAAKTVQVSTPIDMATGNTYIIQSDIQVPGLGGGLSLARTWNSKLPAIQNSFSFMFGAKWRSTYEEHLVFYSNDPYVKYLRSDGAVWSFGVDSADMTSNTYKLAAPASDTTTVLLDGSSTWTMTFKGGEKRLFDSTTGALVSIIDRNGNTTTLSYDVANRLATVTDPAARHLYFNYPDNVTSLVSSVTTDVGVSISYAYDQGRLAMVTEPDSTTLSFTYDTQSMITAVKDSDGKILESHTYDILGRGLSGSRANGIDSVTVSYPQ